jgi:hypothetical protein
MYEYSLPPMDDSIKFLQSFSNTEDKIVEQTDSTIASHDINTGVSPHLKRSMTYVAPLIATDQDVDARNPLMLEFFFF